MKRKYLCFFLLAPLTAMPQQGYEIKVTVKPFKNQYIYLGHYFGKTYPIVDSAFLNDKGVAVFKGKDKLHGGVYLIGYPDKSGYFEILVDKDQHFAVRADTSTIPEGVIFEGSPENTLFYQYQQQMIIRNKRIHDLKQQLIKAGDKTDSSRLLAELNSLEKEIKNIREDIIKNHSGTLLATLLTAMREPELSEKLKNPQTREDSMETYQFYKRHYWDGVNFWDGRLAYTTFFEEKLDKYFNLLVPLHPDSVIKEIDYMLGYASIDKEMTRFLLIKFANRYFNQKYMWEDAVFIHLYEKYFANKNYPWLSEKGRKSLTDRAYSLMANILGNPAQDIVLPDMNGNLKGLYDVIADFTVVVFWDPICGHCKEVLPRLDSFYHTKWKAAGLKMFAVAKETDGNIRQWIDFIKEKKLDEWIHVYYSKEDEKKRIQNNIPGYSQLYDVQSFPTVYLLDKEKRIVAKKLSVEQTDEILQIKLKDN